MKMQFKVRRSSVRIAFGLWFILSAAAGLSAQSAGGCNSYAGRYEMPGQSVLLVSVRDDKLTARPIFWRSVQQLEPAGPDRVAIADRPERQLVFERDGRGCVSAVRAVNFEQAEATFRKVGPALLPAELLLSGRPQEAAVLLARRQPGNEKAFAEMAHGVVENFGSRSIVAAAFLRAGLRFFPNSAELQVALGDAYIGAGQRVPARASYLRAYQLDKTNVRALRMLARLNAVPPGAPAQPVGWTVLFSLDRLFIPPTRAEIEKVWTDWSRRDLEPREVREVRQGRMKVGDADATVRVFAFRIHGALNYGAVIVPDGIGTGRAPAIVDLKGVSPDFFPLQLTRLTSVRAMGSDAGRFIYIVPSFRGERLIFEGQEYKSEGDPNDSWDGATDDSISFLTAALAATPQADATRIAAFGKSRGGTLALLMGIRDRRIKLIEDWSGPVDWFRLVGAYGWNPREIEGDALRYRVKPEEDGGQFVGTFLTQAIMGERGLEAVRLHMIASSPLFFAERLPPTQAHHGVEDEMVPAQNGRELLSVFNSRKLRPPGHQVFFYPDAGHDLYEPLARRHAHDFIFTHFVAPK
jgi:hypothetical protein